jgi:8-oxo-dGTP pyrophosphatase MutT (NUDIX family)
VTGPGDVVRAAGGLVTRPAPVGLEVLVVHRPRYDDWSLPKGKAEPGETDEETACREVEEETGYQCVLGEEVASHRYVDRRGRDKQVRYWRMTVAREGAWAPNHEVDDRRWLTPAAALDLLTYTDDRELVATLANPDARSEPRR